MRFNHLLAGSAIALVLTAGVSAHAGMNGNISLDGVPQIEPAKVIITAKDINRSASADPDAVVPVSRKDAVIPPPVPAEVVITPADIAIEPASTANAPRTATPGPDWVPMTVTPDDAAKGQDTNPAASTPAQPAPEFALDPLGARLRDALSATATDKQFDGKTRASLDTFYLARKYAPVWTDNGAMNERAKAVIAQLKHADADGLDPADYPVPTLEANAGPDALADFELKLTDSVITYARHAAVGRVHWSRVSRDIYYDIPAPEAADVLGKLAATSDARAALDSYNPQHEYYKALKAKLAEIRGGGEDDKNVRIGDGPVLLVGMQDSRVPDLRTRLGVTAKAGDTTYDEALADAVKAFQKKHNLQQDGVVGPGTIRAFNGGPRNARAEDLIIANLERWRWISHDLGPSHVIVNIPEFMLRLYNNGSLLWQTRVVVGKPSTPTPLLSETMKFITVNPTWNVPPSIVYGEYLPALQQDPTVLARMGLHVSYNRDGGVHISQPPGPGNALGRIRFNFPNKFSVYQHDTPDKYMFAHTKRAYSHGCMRVQDPDVYAAKLLSVALPNEHYTAERIRGMYGHGEVNINFPTPIPVHLTYQTAYVDSSGDLVLRDDVYGRDSRVLAALKTDERYASTPVEPRRAASRPVRQQVYRAPQQQSRGFNFFGLFR
jgi:murein L,D-transpeptidase YcbB/YkuD